MANERVRRAANAKGLHSKRGGRSSGRVQNNQRNLPPKVAAMFDKLLSRSLRDAGANQQLQKATAEANAKFSQEQARLMGSLAKQLGLSAIVSDLAALRKRQVALVRDAMEKAQTAIAQERMIPGGAKKLRTRSRY